MSDHDATEPDPAAAGFRLSLVSPNGLGKAWRPPGSDVWHCRFERKGGGTESRRFGRPSHAESWLGRLLCPTGTETAEVLYDGMCDPSVAEDANRETFQVGAPRQMVWNGLLRETDYSPWAMTIRQERSELEGRRVFALATSEARRRREQDRARRPGGR